MKWTSVRNEPGQRRFFVCNAAEGEPGTYKDRRLMSLNPYQLIEGIQIGAYAVGAERAFVGIKRSFDEQISRLERALAEMEAAGLVPTPVEMVYGPDEYLFGEEKALMEVIEGNPPLPRILPPYLHGLFQSSEVEANPTAVNNVETLSNVGHIMRRGADWFRSFGTMSSPGTMMFTLSGDVRAPGVYELPLGVPLGTLVNDIGGGPQQGRRLKLVLPGASTTIITPDMLEVPLDFDAMRTLGTGLGSGGFIVFDDSTCIVEMSLVYSRFLAVESCGQCPACKSGTTAITEALYRIQNGNGTEEDLDVALARSVNVTDAARCALPTGENRIVQSTMRTFPDEFHSHLGKACPSPRDLEVAKFTGFDPATGAFTVDGTYRRKRPSWTYAPEGEPVWPAGEAWQRS